MMMAGGFVGNQGFRDEINSVNKIGKFANAKHVSS